MMYRSPGLHPWVAGMDVETLETSEIFEFFGEFLVDCDPKWLLLVIVEVAGISSVLALWKKRGRHLVLGNTNIRFDCMTLSWATIRKYQFTFNLHYIASKFDYCHLGRFITEYRLY